MYWKNRNQNRSRSLILNLELKWAHSRFHPLSIILLFLAHLEFFLINQAAEHFLSSLNKRTGDLKSEFARYLCLLPCRIAVSINKCSYLQFLKMNQMRYKSKNLKTILSIRKTRSLHKLPAKMKKLVTWNQNTMTKLASRTTLTILKRTQLLLKWQQKPSIMNASN